MLTDKNRRQFLKTLGGITATVTLGQNLPPLHKMEQQTYDLIVVGAGTAGMPCAIAAAQKGGRVLVVEKASRVGGNGAGHSSSTRSHHNEVIRFLFYFM